VIVFAVIAASLDRSPPELYLRHFPDNRQPKIGISYAHDCDYTRCRRWK
jgi:hypothetical protein